MAVQAILCGFQRQREPGTQPCATFAGTLPAKVVGVAH